MPDARASGKSVPPVCCIASETAATRQAPRPSHWGTVRTSARCADHFLIRRKAAGCLLGEGKAAIDGNLENPAAGLTQGDVGGWMGLQDQVPRCQGARLVASHAAEFNFDLHLFGHPSVGGSACSLAATVKMGKKDAIFGCKE
jgi:hypothetical protein